MSLVADVSMIRSETEHASIGQGRSGKTRHFVFGHCRVDRDQRLLVSWGQKRSLEPRAFDLLMYLIDHRDRVVGRDELLQSIWKTRYLSESVVARAVMKVRRALQDRDEDPIIETLYRVGYRFACTLAPTPEETDAENAQAEASAAPVDEDATFIAEALTRYALAMAEHRYVWALKYIDVCLADERTALRVEAEEIAQMAAASDALTPFRAAAALATARETCDWLAQAKVLCILAKFHQYAGQQSKAQSVASQALECANRAQAAVLRPGAPLQWKNEPADEQKVFTVDPSARQQ